MKAEATVAVLVEQPGTAPVHRDNHLGVYKNVILGKNVGSNQVSGQSLLHSHHLKKKQRV